MRQTYRTTSRPDGMWPFALYVEKAFWGARWLLRRTGRRERNLLVRHRSSVIDVLTAGVGVDRPL
jgi:hypothetical protein